MSILKTHGVSHSDALRRKEKPYGNYALHALNLKKQFTDITFTWIRRELNHIADSLSRQALYRNDVLDESL